MTSTPLSQRSSTAACMWSDYEGELYVHDNFPSTNSHIPRRHIPCIFRSEEANRVISLCDLTSDDSSGSESSSDEEPETECEVEIDDSTVLSLKRKICSEELNPIPESLETENVEIVAHKKQRTSKEEYVFTPEDDALILHRVRLGTEKRPALWKELSEKYGCSVFRITNHFNANLKSFIAPSKAHLSSQEVDEYIKKTVQRWEKNTDKTKVFHWASLASRIGCTPAEVQLRWEEFKAVSTAVKVQRSKKARRVIRADDRIYQHLAGCLSPQSTTNTTPAYSMSNTNLCVVAQSIDMMAEITDNAEGTVVVQEPVNAVAGEHVCRELTQMKPESTVLVPEMVTTAPIWYTALQDSESQSDVSYSVVASHSPREPRPDIPTAPHTPTRSPYHSQTDSYTAEYWQTIATAKDKDAYIMAELNSRATAADCVRLATLFGWSVDAVKGRWRQLNPNRCGLPVKSAVHQRRLGFGANHISPVRPRASKHKTNTIHRTAKPVNTSLTLADKDAILIRTVSAAVSTASPVNWQYLAGLFDLSIEEIKTYYHNMDIQKCIENLIILRVQLHNIPVCIDSFVLWHTINREIGIVDTLERWTEITARLELCFGCGYRPCECMHREKCNSSRSSSDSSSNTVAISVGTEPNVVSVSSVEVMSHTCSELVSEIIPLTVESERVVSTTCTNTTPTTPLQHTTPTLHTAPIQHTIPELPVMSPPIQVMPIVIDLTEE